jgi:hypothetical protein
MFIPNYPFFATRYKNYLNWTYMLLPSCMHAWAMNIHVYVELGKLIYAS